MVISLRLGSTQHMDHEYINELTKSISKFKGCVDEVWFATSYGLLTIEQSCKSAQHMNLEVKGFEKIGVIPSMQISRTIGHGESLLKLYGGDGIKNLNVNKVVSIDGEVCDGKFCWNNQAFRKYIYEITKEYVVFKPHTVWVDDDLRIGHHGKSKALCFCDNCLTLFNKEYGFSYNRQQLKKDFLYGDISIREKYIAFNTKSLAEFAGIIAKAVYEVSPGSFMAIQNGGDTALETNAQRACLDAMKKPSGKAPKFRAGGGYYDDHDPNGILQKAMQLNYINSRLPEYVEDKTCEIENLPFVAYGKSPEGACLEASAYIAYGCNMASFSMNMHKNEDMTWYERIFRKFSEYKPYWETVVKHNKNTCIGGISVYQSNKSNLIKIKEGEVTDWNDTCIFEANGLLRCGIPLHTSPTGNAYILSSKSCDFLCDEDIDFLIGQPVITDAKTIEKIVAMGYGDKIDIQVEKVPPAYNAVSYERPTDHFVNRNINLESWNNSAYYSRDARYFINSKNAEYISELYARIDNQRLGYAMAVVTTSKNKKWLVMSAHLCDGIISFERRNQILSALNYISENTIPAFVNSPEQVIIIPRVNDKGETVSVTLINASISDCESFEVVIRNPKDNQKYTIAAPNENPEQCFFRKNGNDFIAEIPSLKAWRIKTLMM